MLGGAQGFSLEGRYPYFMVSNIGYHKNNKSSSICQAIFLFFWYFSIPFFINYKKGLN